MSELNTTTFWKRDSYYLCCECENLLYFVLHLYFIPAAYAVGLCTINPGNATLACSESVMPAVSHWCVRNGKCGTYTYSEHIAHRPVNAITCFHPSHCAWSSSVRYLYFPHSCLMCRTSNSASISSWGMAVFRVINFSVTWDRAEEWLVTWKLIHTFLMLAGCLACMAECWMNDWLADWGTWLGEMQ